MQLQIDTVNIVPGTYTMEIGVTDGNGYKNTELIISVYINDSPTCSLPAPALTWQVYSSVEIIFNFADTD